MIKSALLIIVITASGSNLNDSLASIANKVPALTSQAIQVQDMDLCRQMRNELLYTYKTGVSVTCTSMVKRTPREDKVYYDAIEAAKKARYKASGNGWDEIDEP